MERKETTEAEVGLENRVGRRIEQWVEAPLDARSSQVMHRLFRDADRLIASYDQEYLSSREKEMCADPSAYTPSEHLAIKAAISKKHVQSVREDTHLQIVVPIYHEAIRMSPRNTSTDKIGVNTLEPDINGEDALLRKYAEMEWLTKGTKVDYSLIFVDDICDQKSGQVAEQLIEANELKKASVLYLQDAIDQVEPGSIHQKAIQTVIETRESIRGGSLCLGFAEAVSRWRSGEIPGNNLIGYVDADVSYSMTLWGIPLNEILDNKNVKAATASRQHPLSYVEPPQGEAITSHRTNGLIRLKQTVGYLRRAVLGEDVPADTQSGFKLIRPEVVEETLIEPGKANNFSYDTQLLARISRRHPGTETIKPFGVVCLDSDALSTANNGVTYLEALKIIRTIANEFGLDSNGTVGWLLDHLTSSKENYYKARNILEDGASIDNIPPEHPASELLENVRRRIVTTKDTTAVGKYFDDDLADSLRNVLAAASL